MWLRTKLEPARARGHAEDPSARSRAPVRGGAHASEHPGPKLLPSQEAEAWGQGDPQGVESWPLCPGPRLHRSLGWACLNFSDLSLAGWGAPRAADGQGGDGSATCMRGPPH